DRGRRGRPGRGRWAPYPPGVPPGDLLGGSRLDLRELNLGDLGEQRMDPVPPSTLEALDEEVRVLEPVEGRRRVESREDLVAQLGGEVPQDGRVEEEPPRLRVERAEDLVVQVLGDEPVIAAQLPVRHLRVRQPPG